MNRTVTFLFIVVLILLGGVAGWYAELKQHEASL